MIRKRIALVTTYFPPQNGVAVNRMEAFAAYLSDDFEVEIFSLTQSKSYVGSYLNVKVNFIQSNSIFERLADKQEDGVLWHKVKTGIRIVLAQFISSPLKKWMNRTKKQLVSSHLKKPYDAIITSFSPEETHLIGVDFKKEFQNVQWIADMRDEMSKNPFINEKRKQKLQSIEMLVNEFADALTTVSEPILNDFKTICSKIQNFCEVRNGYNHALVEKFLGHSPNNKDIIKIGYFGTFYGKIKPDTFFDAIQRSEFKNYEIHLYGVHSNFIIPNELSDKVFVHPKVPYIEALTKMNEMDFNLFVHPRSERKGVYTGKLFDYISAAKPILACVDKDDVAAKMIEEFDCGYIAEFSEVSEIQKQLSLAFTDFNQGVRKCASKENIESIHRKNEVNKLKELIVKLTVK